MSKKTPPAQFVPQNAEEDRLRNIAVALGESDMSFILSQFLLPYGFKAIVDAFEEVQARQRSKPGHFRNPRAYFNKLVREFRAEYITKSAGNLDSMTIK